MNIVRDPHSQWDALFSRVLDGAATPEEITQLHGLLRQTPEAMDAWIRLTHLHAELASGVLLEERGEIVQVNRILPEDALAHGAEPSKAVESTWLRKFGRIAAALVAGLLLGGFGNSALRAVTEARWGKVATLLADSFDSDVPPLVTGPSEQTGVWSGDFTEMVGAQQGVLPRSGQKMLRFVSSTFQGKEAGTESYIGDVYRLLDVRPYAKELASGDLRLGFSAHFNTHAYTDQEPYSAGIYLHALSEKTIRKGLLKANVHQLLEESLAASMSQTPLDRDPTTWQRGTAELRLPPQTEFVWIHLTLAHPSRRSPEGPRTFSGHFLDDAEAVLLRKDVKP